IFSDWRAGYSAIFFVQLSAAVFVFFTVLKGYWKPQKKICEEKISFDSQKIFLKSKIFFAVQWIIFFLYAAAEYSVTFWTVSVLIDGRGEFFAVASLFPAVYLGSLMTGRIVFGYANNSDADPKIIRLGFFLAVIGLIVLTFSNSVVGIVLVGYGFAPIFPCLMNVTKKRFDPQSLYKSVGLQIAAAGAGVTLSAVSMGRLLEKISMAALFPAVIFFVLVSFVLNEIIEAKLKKISRELNSK
ncbi:MAG: hypothetical protein FWD19_01305, partial [Defluviitaleaceae bacterium]|nr:hypothetical protein [Defluviitaleaceae bacterium]